MFTVSVSPAAGQQVTVPYSVVAGTAAATQDYKPNGAPNSPLTFGASETAKTISIPVIGDLLKEANETLFVDLGPVTGATLGDARGQGTILNDDVCTIVGTSQANSIVGTPGDDHICGLGGDDV